MHTPEQRLEELGITLPPPPRPLGAYIPWVRTGSLLYVSGQLPLQEGKMVHPGLLGREVSAEEGAACARIAAINALAIAKESLGGLGAVRQVVRVAGYVAATDSFTGHSQVVNGASDLLAEVFGDRGRHARVAIGSPSLPACACVELEILFESA
jgi:enamine deaminase RidA (YjgF/YER057c/UK114 family)